MNMSLILSIIILNQFVCNTDDRLLLSQWDKVGNHPGLTSNLCVRTYSITFYENTNGKVIFLQNLFYFKVSDWWSKKRKKFWIYMDNWSRLWETLLKLLSIDVSSIGNFIALSATRCHGSCVVCQDSHRWPQNNFEKGKQRSICFYYLISKYIDI